ncbi:hypothetical protein ACIF8T_27965 [Streptomyces sp. NPDC085946]|uniref:hypothetical protein n=1 Tax=Streptomyces sp. NPDC085946 TaxID=3365744 RepID=UPI0037D9249E
MLADAYGTEVALRVTTPLWVERPAGTGEAVRSGREKDPKPFLATGVPHVAPVAGGAASSAEPPDAARAGPAAWAAREVNGPTDPTSPP